MNNSSNKNIEICPDCFGEIITYNNIKVCHSCGYRPPSIEIKNSELHLENTQIANIALMKKTEVKITDDGIYVPSVDVVPEGCEPNYKLLISKEMFIEAYNKWIAPLLEK